MAAAVNGWLGSSTSIASRSRASSSIPWEAISWSAARSGSEMKMAAMAGWSARSATASRASSALSRSSADGDRIDGGRQACAGIEGGSVVGHWGTPARKGVKGRIVHRRPEALDLPVDLPSLAPRYSAT